MGVSRELEIGKAGEHLVCADLIVQGFSAFLADQGMPYDVIVAVPGGLRSIQVRTTRRLRHFPKTQKVYRFGMRRGKGGVSRPTEADGIDYFAFVALDIREIAYFHVSRLIAKTGKIKQTVDFKSRRAKYRMRVYSSGKSRAQWARFLEDYNVFPGR